MNKLLQVYKDLKIIRKIQFGFLIIAIISTILAVNDLREFRVLRNVNQNIFDNFVQPSQEITAVTENLNEIQSWMLKLSNPKFSSVFDEGIKRVSILKQDLDKEFKRLQNHYKGTDFEDYIKKIKDVWDNYNLNVTDGIISAASMQLFDMAADIATSEGTKDAMAINNNLKSFQDKLRNNAESLQTESDDAVSRASLLLIVGMILGTLVFLFAVFILGPSISNPVVKLKKIIEEYSIGKYDSHLEIHQKDEVGELADMLRKLRDAQKEKIEAAVNIANGNFVDVTPVSEYDEFAKAFNRQVTIIKEMKSNVDILALKNKEEGDLSYRMNADNFNGEWKNIPHAVNDLLDKISEPIGEAGEILNKMAQGDFTVRMTGDYKGDYAKIKNDVNTLSESMEKALGQVKTNVVELINAAEEISSATDKLAVGANDQSIQSSEVASAVEEMTRTIIENSNNVVRIGERSREAEVIAEKGGEAVLKTVEGINEVSDIVFSTSTTMEELGQSSEKIGEVIKVINDIADQTNLLALNAAIEAARAGEQGRGFAVVADEVRKLAERTQKATKEIENMINEIQVRTEEAIKAINQSAEVVVKDKEMAQEAGKMLKDIIDNSVEITGLIEQFAAALEQESKTSEEISRNIEAINAVASENAESTSMINRSAEFFYSSTDTLNKMMEKFKVNLNKLSMIER